MKSIKKKIIVWTIVGVLIAITVGILVFLDYCIQHEITPKQYFEILEISHKEKIGLEYEKVYLPSGIIPSIDGAAYVSPIVNGDTIKIEGNIYNAVITPDKSKIVAVEKDGNLFITDLALSYRESIAKKADCLIAVTNEGVIYKDTKDVFHRYLFEDARKLSLGKVTDYVVSEQGLNIAFADRWGKVYILKAESDKKEKVGTYSESAELLSLSNDGNRLSYENYKSDGSTECCVIGEEEVPVNTSGEYSERYVYYGDYVYDGETDSLYLVDRENGEWERVMSNLKDYEYVIDENDNKIYYITAVGKLDVYELDKDGLKIAPKPVIDETVNEVMKVGNQMYCEIYDEDRGMVALEAYRLGGEKFRTEFGNPTAMQICSYAEDIKILGFSEDGNTIYYFVEDPRSDNMAHSVWTQGDLMKWTCGDREEVKIAEDIDYSSLTDDLWLGKGEDNILDVESFIVKQVLIEYPETEEEWANYDGINQYKINWIYYDGVESRVFLEEEVFAEPYVFYSYTLGDMLAGIPLEYVIPNTEYLLDGTNSGTVLNIKEDTE